MTVNDDVIARIQQTLVEQHGSPQAERIEQGLRQTAARWRPADGDADAFAAFATEHFLADPDTLRETAQHLEYALEMVDGHLYEIEREISRYQQLDEGPLRPIDSLLDAYSPSSHTNEDLFSNRIAFVALLNFPLTTLEERLTKGATWTREQWALARLTGRFEHRLPADVLQRIEHVNAAAERYIDNYNVHVDRLASRQGSAGFAPGKKLISHWGLRDEIRALYAQPDGLPRQRLLARVMDRIIHQQIPAAVVDSGELEWDPEANLVRPPGAARWAASDREPDVRYEQLLAIFRAHQLLDPFHPELPTHVDRVFAGAREMPEQRVRALLESVLSAPVAKRVGQLIQKRLGRPLEPFDIWYAGFRPQSKIREQQLDELTRSRYPDPRSFQQDLPRIFGDLGFSSETAQFLAEHIVVDPSRGAGHAAGAKRRADLAHLRTRIGPQGMDYKGYNIAIHELGHNVEQVFSNSKIDHTLLGGVPNTGFTEAFAFVFQTRDLELLGQTSAADPQAESYRDLDRFWTTFEIAGVAWLDMAIWHWLVEHPNASPAELREAMVRLAQELWNRFYAPVFGVRDVALHAIYSHIIAYGLYTPDYPLGHLITAQVEAYVKSRSLAVEMERMCRLGRLAPDIWMQQAVGAGISSSALIDGAEAALTAIKP